MTISLTQEWTEIECSCEDFLSRSKGEVWLSQTQLLASSQPAAACTVYQQRVVGLCWRGLVDFLCWFSLKINIFAGPLQSSYFPGLIDDNEKLQGFVATIPSNPFTLCKINWGLVTRSWLNLVQNISLCIILTCGHAIMDPPQATRPNRTVWQGDISKLEIFLIVMVHTVFSISAMQNST